MAGFLFARTPPKAINAGPPRRTQTTNTDKMGFQKAELKLELVTSILKRRDCGFFC
jgi:hypothetical protein